MTALGTKPLSPARHKAPRLTPAPPLPPCRRLAIYAFDPALIIDNRTAAFAKATVNLPWGLPFDKPMEPGPINEYLEVIDVDPESGRYYQPVDLDDPHLLATDGYAPSESNPQFHQQMAFAVAMHTIVVFEEALGRRVLWSIRHDDFSYVPRLRIYPHALRQRNAYYSPSKKALLFGYYPAPINDVNSIPGMWIFGCLSHDIVAHETSHAILDGINSRLIEDFGPDSLAFHEGLSDIVALLQHFTFPDAVRAEIGSHVGDLDAPTLLSGLARQFGFAAQSKAMMPKGPLREAVTGKPGDPDTPDDLSGYTGAHERGARLLSAVYQAFIETYERAANDLFALVGPRAPGAPLHPLLLDRLTQAAVASAGHIRRMCIRALDYLPPTTVSFGEYLRAIVTADIDLYPADDRGFRRALIAAFRRYGVVPEGVRSLADDSLRWDHEIPPESARPPLPMEVELDLDALFEREALFRQSQRNGRIINGLLRSQPELCRSFGLLLDAGTKRSVFCKGDDTPPVAGSAHVPFLEVHTVRISRRADSNGGSLRQLIIGINQRRRGYYDEAQQDQVDAGTLVPPPDPDFVVRGGVTLVIDLRTYRRPSKGDADGGTSIFGLPRTIIVQAIADDSRLTAMRSHREEVDAAALALAYAPPAVAGSEPLALLHAALDPAHV